MASLSDILKSATPGDELIEWHAKGDLALLLPEVDCLFGVPQRPEHHPEVDTGVHVAMALDMAQRLGASEAARFAVLLHDLGKGLTPPSEWPMHVDHENRGLEPVKAVCARLKVPQYWCRLALLVCEHHLQAHRAFEMRSKSMLRLLSETGLEADFMLLEDFVMACEADKRGRQGRQERAYPQGQYMRAAARSLQAIPMAQGTPLEGRDSQERHRARLEAVRNAGLPLRQALEQAKAQGAKSQGDSHVPS